VYGLRGDAPILYPNARIAICEQADAVGWANRCRTRRRSHKTKDWRSITRRRRLIVVEARRMGITNTAELSDASNCSRRSVVHSVGHHVGCAIGLLKKPGAGAGRTDRRIKSDFGLSLLARGLLAKFAEIRPIRPNRAWFRWGPSPRKIGWGFRGLFRPVRPCFGVSLLVNLAKFPNATPE
jgi:hypothetical protein